MTGELRLDQEAWCEIRVAGRLSEEACAAACDLCAGVLREGGQTVTTLTGPVSDQAALRGLLERLYALGLPLLSVTCRPIAADCAEPDAAPEGG